MTWEQTLLDATFRGVTLPILLAVEDRIERDVAEHESPYVNGAETEDLGEKARRFQFVVLVSGPRYEAERDAILRALAVPGPGTLVHPIWGAHQVQLKTCSVHHDAEHRDACRLTLLFITHKTDTRLFANAAPGAAANKAEAAATKADAALAKALVIPPKPGLLTLLRQRLTTLRQHLSTLRRAVNVVVAGVRDAAALMNMPRTFLAELRATYRSLSGRLESALEHLQDSLPGNSRSRAHRQHNAGIKRATWQTGLAAVRQASASQPLPPGAASALQPDLLRTHIAEQICAATAIATLAAEILADEALYPDLPPPDIEHIAATARQLLLSAAATLDPADLTQSSHPHHLALALRISTETPLQGDLARLLAADLLAINSQAAATPSPRLLSLATAVQPQLIARLANRVAPPFDAPTARSITAPLRDCADHLHQAAKEAIDQRPPLLARQAPLDGNLAMIAHAWYADATRADELARLNPQVRNPNFIRRGQWLTAYAR